MGGDGSQITTAHAPSFLPFASLLSQVHQRTGHIFFVRDRPGDREPEILRCRLQALGHVCQVGPGTLEGLVIELADKAFFSRFREELDSYRWDLYAE